MCRIAPRAGGTALDPEATRSSSVSPAARTSDGGCWRVPPRPSRRRRRSQRYYGSSCGAPARVSRRQRAGHGTHDMMTKTSCWTAHPRRQERRSPVRRCARSKQEICWAAPVSRKLHDRTEARERQACFLRPVMREREPCRLRDAMPSTHLDHRRRPREPPRRSRFASSTAPLQKGSTSSPL